LLRFKRVGVYQQRPKKRAFYDADSDPIRNLNLFPSGGSIIEHLLEPLNDILVIHIFNKRAIGYILQSVIERKDLQTMVCKSFVYYFSLI
jgi:hypothetical protein